MSSPSRRVMAANPRLDSLMKILAQERASGYQDSTVIGGLDRFLQHWAKELEPVLREGGALARRPLGVSEEDADRIRARML